MVRRGLLEMKSLVYFITLVVCALNSVRCIQPVITTDHAEVLQNHGRAIVVEPGQTFTLHCEAPTPVNWTSGPVYYETDGYIPMDLPPVVNISKWQSTTNGSSQYFSDFRVERSYSSGTGYYYCSTDNATDVADVNNVARIYVYVKDDYVILLGPETPFQTAVEYGTHVIPCRPTSPDVEVSLQVDGQRIDGIGQERNGTSRATFDPTIGFTLENLNLTDSNAYHCVAKRADGVQQEEISVLHVLRYTESVPVPAINGSSVQLDGVKGNTIVLECSVIISIDVEVTMAWIIPDKTAVKSERIVDHGPTSAVAAPVDDLPMRTVEKLLTIKNATLDDEGLYQCNVKDHNGHTSSMQKHLHIITGSV